MAELERTYSYDDKGKPVMVIYKKLAPVKTFRFEKPVVDAYVIQFNDIWMFSRDHYPALVRVFYGYDSQGQPMTGEEIMTYERAMYAKCDELCHQFDLGLVTSSRMAQIASMIEDGISDLLKMPPQAERSQRDGFTETMKITHEQSV